MPEITIHIGGRDFAVACQDGEEPFLQAAAAMLDGEAQSLTGQLGRMPEARMLLMAGLMLADRTAGQDERLAAAEARAAAAEAALAAIKADPPRVEVPAIPQIVIDTLAELAARAEALADRTEEQAAAT